MPLSGYGIGVLVKSHEGRATKIEGNPDHPISLGASNVFAQASLLDLYDPDRAQGVTNAGEISSWAALLGALSDALQLQSKNQGVGLRLLSGTVTSPTLAWQIRRVLEKFPRAKWHQYEPVNRDNELSATETLFAKKVQPQYHFDKAEVIVSLESDFLSGHPASLRYARQFTDGRRLTRSDQTRMNRLYVAESSPTITGSMADHRLRVDSSRIEDIAQALLQAVGVDNGNAKLSRVETEWIQAAAADLRRSNGKSLIIAGDQQPPEVHALAHYLNDWMGNFGHTVSYTERVEAEPVLQLDSITRLVEEMKAGEVELLLILGANPVFTAPADLQFATAMRQVKMAVQLSTHADETSAHCHWHIPEAHYLESWSDVRAWDGTASIIQPLIEPLFAGKSVHQVLDAFFQLPPRSDFEVVQEYWRSRKLWTDFDKGWRRALHDGVVAGTELQPVNVTVAKSFTPEKSARVDAEHLELSFRPDPSIWDGRFANNGWLQELPRPITKLTWDNALLISPALAARHSLQTEQVVSVQTKHGTIEAPVCIVPGQADRTISLHLGYGRSHSGRVGKDVGVNAYALRSSDALFSAQVVKLNKTGEYHKLAVTQSHHTVAGRDIFHATTLSQFQHNPAAHLGEAPPARDETLYHPDEFLPRDYAWGMVIDLNTCIGCNACIIACQAENNIPVVGKDQVRRGREMHWIRVDSYFHGSSSDPEINHQPVPCMHCENAPCELVCPVEATLHDSEGLNLQVYNRCVGTRYCSNNCPYKVRRFNFLQYSDQKTPTLQLMHNPEVTVRTRGVMEKCTYCIQRISVARIEAEKENRAIRDGELKTACQQACPAQAIVFGNIRDPASKVTELKSHPLNYGMLAELNTRPRTSYLARVRNPTA